MNTRSNNIDTILDILRKFPRINLSNLTKLSKFPSNEIIDILYDLADKNIVFSSPSPTGSVYFTISDPTPDNHYPDEIMDRLSDIVFKRVMERLNELPTTKVKVLKQVKKEVSEDVPYIVISGVTDKVERDRLARVVRHKLKHDVVYIKYSDNASAIERIMENCVALFVFNIESTSPQHIQWCDNDKIVYIQKGLHAGSKKDLEKAIWDTIGTTIAKKALASIRSIIES